MLKSSILAVIIISTTWVLTYWVRKFALKNNMIDVPNERSSHSKNIPRGGGLAFASTFLVFTILAYFQGYLPESFTIGLVGGGLLVSGAGWLDDQKDLSPAKRLFIHFLAALWALYWLGGLPHINLGIIRLYLSWAGTILAIFGVMWMINLYNFMDGIDGIAGSETFIVSTGAGILFAMLGSSTLAIVCFILCLSVLGFLLWNWPPAKIFMGDVGSGFLGFVFSVLMITSENTNAIPLLVWIMLLGVFVVDATATLFWRLINGEKLHLAHHTHVYQLAVQVGYSHKQVTLTVIGIDIFLVLLIIKCGLQSQWFLPLVSIVVVLLCIFHTLLRKKFNSIISSDIGRIESHTNRTIVGTRSCE